jgi:peptidoglycan hydrolase CwlO-like protein
MMKVLFIASFLMGFSSAAKVTPVQKVIELLNNMVEKGTKEKQDEQVQFASYKGFCDNTVSQKQAAIAEASEMIDVLTADIEKYEAEAEELGKAISAHDADISTWEGDLVAAGKVREIEHVDYVAGHKDLTATIKALEGAINVIKKASGKTEQASALMQISSSRFLPKEGVDVIMQFLQKPGEANAYESQSSGIIDMLSKLAGKFSDERDALEEEEVAAKHSYEMLAADLKRTLGAANDERTQKSVAKGKALQGAADAKGALQDATTTREDDSKYAADLTATCEQKSTDFANRQLLRAEEIEAIGKAIEILSSGAVSGASLVHLSTSFATSFAQLRDSYQSPQQAKVASYLTKRAKQLNSRVLSVFAIRVAADPFKKVKKMIKDLIVKLMEEANGEAEQKGFCDKELATNEHTRKEKSEAVVMLTAEIDELTASVAGLAEQITELTKAVAELDAAVAKATEERTSEKAKNTVTIKDAKAAQTAVASALSVLNEFYAKAAKATSFMQDYEAEKAAQPEAPSSEPYKGMGGAAGGVVGMIEVIQSDFARLEAETSAAEAEAAKEYSEFMTDSKVDKVQKSSDLDHATESKQSQEQSLQEKKVDLEGTQKELDAAMAYYDKLKPTCVSSGPSYEDKVAARKAEIESLQTALQVLNGEAFL